MIGCDWLYLSGGSVVLDGVRGEAEDVLVVAQVEPLAVLQAVVHHSDRSHVEQQLPCLAVEQVVPAVEAPVPEEPQQHITLNSSGGSFYVSCQDLLLMLLL